MQGLSEVLEHAKMRITVKNQPKLQLADLLKRRKMSLLQFITEHAITTYDGLCSRCERMGVAPPTDDEYRTGVPSPIVVNNPQEGVVVVEPPVIDSGVVVVTQIEETMLEPTVNTQKHRRKKKGVTQID